MAHFLCPNRLQIMSPRRWSQPREDPMLHTRVLHYRYEKLIAAWEEHWGQSRRDDNRCLELWDADDDSDEESDQGWFQFSKVDGPTGSSHPDGWYSDAIIQDRTIPCTNCSTPSGNRRRGCSTCCQTCVQWGLHTAECADRQMKHHKVIRLSEWQRKNQVRFSLEM